MLLLTDVDALLPATNPPPLATVVIDSLRAAVRNPSFALVATTAHPEAVDPRVRGVDLLDRSVSVPLPDAQGPHELLRVLLRDVPVESDVDFGRAGREDARFRRGGPGRPAPRGRRACGGARGVADRVRAT